MSYHDLLHQYGTEQESAETRVYIYVQQPGKLSTPAEVINRDKMTAETITRLETLLDDLRDYRQALAARYGELETMPYTRRLRLTRWPHMHGPVEYTVTITRTFEDGTNTSELSECYPGKERRNAIARYEELKKQNPGIPAEMDIEKRSWER